jgi:hypothetical protein
MHQTLTCRTLGDLGEGAAALVIDAALNEAMRDVDDRGHEDGKVRKVQITVELEKLDNGQVKASVEAAAMIPKRRTPSTFGNLRFGKTSETSEFHFQSLDRKDPDQRTIDELLKNEGRDG